MYESASELIGLARALAARMQATAAAELPEEAVQIMLQAAVLAYFRRREDGADFGPFLDEQSVSATAAMVAAANILQAAEVEVFELGMWKTLTGA